jgi:hypothetical protein
MRCYGWGPDRCWVGVTSAEGWVRYNWALENEMTMFGAVFKLSGPGYVKQETLRLVEQWQSQAKLKSV